MQDFFACKAPLIGVLPKRLLNGENSRNLVRVMKLTAFILLAFCLQLSAKTGAQDRITLKEKNAPLSKILMEIQKQTGYSFLLSEETIKDSKPIDIDVKNAPIREVLDVCFKNQPFTYFINQNAITIIPKKSGGKDGNNGESSQGFIDIRGRVVDANGQAVAGATITVQGTSKTTVSNADGSFTLTGIEENAVITISHVQYEMQSLTINGRSTVNAILQIKISSLDEMQIIAYGTTTKRLNTGNVSSVKATDIQKQPVSNPLLALQGRVPGLFITQSTGLPGSGVTVRIQGQNSIMNGNDPLYVIDGVPYTSQLLPNLGSVLGSSGAVNTVSPGGGNPLSYINPSDIESIEILKDADATSIYGSRAANGAILITTKKGKAGQTKVDINMQRGVGKVTRKLDLLNTTQYLEMRNEAKRNDNLTILPTDYDINGVWDTTQSTDWQKKLVGNTAQYTDVQASISGGNNTTQFLVSGGYHRETTVFPGDFADQKGSVHFNLNNTSYNQKFRFQLSGNYLIDNNKLSASDFMNSAVTLPPDAPPLYNEDGTLNWAPNTSGNTTWPNAIHPVANLHRIYKNRTSNIVSNAVVGYQILKGLEIKTTLGYTSLQTNESSTSPLKAIAPELRPSTLRSSLFANTLISSWQIEPQLHYELVIAKGKLQTLLGTTIYQRNDNGMKLSGNGFNSDAVLEDIKSASAVSVTNTTITSYKYNALFGRLNYNWQDKYIVNFTCRRDGSSRFGPENMFNNFWSVGGGWIFSKEKFVQKKLSFLSFGKFRASYGTTGNDQIGDYKFLSQYNSGPFAVGVPYQGAVGLSPNSLPNPFLQWEETRKLQFGLELGLINDRILLTSNYYRNRSSSQLLSYLLPYTTGFSFITENFPATFENSGWEFSFSSANIKTKAFNWSTNINLTLAKNKLVDFPDLTNSSYAFSFVIGQPFTIRKLYPFVGVDPLTGKYTVADNKGNPTSTPNGLTDNTVLINLSPTVYGGFQNSIIYKGFELNFLFQFVKQKAANYLFGTNTPAGRSFTNQPTYVLERWQTPGDIRAIQQFSTDLRLLTALNAAQASDACYTDASYIRLKNLSVSWQLPREWSNKINLQSSRCFIQGQNLVTITKYKGLDPENGSVSSLPPLTVLTAGVQIVF